MFEEREVTWKRRIFRAVVLLVINLMSWVIIPAYILGLIAKLSPSSSFLITPTIMYAFGLAITGLQVLGALTEGMSVSVPLLTGSYVAIAYYIYAAVNGGTLTLTSAGIGISLDFQALLYLMTLPPLFSAIRTPLTYLADEHEGVRPSSDLA